jgi:hypothetical protein
MDYAAVVASLVLGYAAFFFKNCNGDVVVEFKQLVCGRQPHDACADYQYVCFHRFELQSYASGAMNGKFNKWRPISQSRHLLMEQYSLCCAMSDWLILAEVFFMFNGCSIRVI